MTNTDAGRTKPASRIIITGANGSGKSHLARRISAQRPDLPCLSFDAVKLTTRWQTRSRTDIDAALMDHVAQPTWLIEGGPSMLPIALQRAQIVIWLNPPTWLRAARLIKRPWTTRGTTRPELPANNPDYILAQTRFAWRSLRKSKETRAFIARALTSDGPYTLLHCRTARDVDAAITQTG